MKKIYNLSLYFINHHVVRFLFSGAAAAAVLFATLFTLVHWLHVWYLLSTTIAFLVAFCVSFSLHKFLTFTEYSRERIPAQLKIYFIVALANLAINALLMYVQVDIMKVHYLAAQFLASGIVALYSFFIYKHFIFHK